MKTHPLIGRKVRTRGDTDGTVIDCAYHQAEESGGCAGFMLLIAFDDGSMNEWAATDCTLLPEVSK
jgi:hypothetical protein